MMPAPEAKKTKIKHRNGSGKIILNRTSTPSLPVDLLPHILSYLDIKSLSLSLRTCKQWNAHDKLASLWRAVCSRTYPDTNPSIKLPSTTWRDFCKQMCKLPLQSHYNYYSIPEGILMGTGVRISIDASTVLCASNGTVSRHGGDVEDHLLIRDILGFKCKKIMPGGYRSDLLSHRDNRVFTVDRRTPKTLKITDTDNPVYVKYLPASYASISALIAHEDGKRIFTGTLDGTIREWNVDSLTCTHVYRGHTDCIWGLAAHGDTLVSAGEDATIRVWNLKTKRSAHTIRAKVAQYGKAIDIRGNWLAWIEDTPFSPRIHVYDLLQRIERETIAVGTGVFRRDTFTSKVGQPKLVFTNQFLLVTHPVSCSVAVLSLHPEYFMDELLGSRLKSTASNDPILDITFSHMHRKCIAVTQGGLVHVWDFGANGADVQSAADRRRTDEEANGVAGVAFNGVDADEYDTSDSEVDYGNYGPGFVPRVKKVWRY